MYLVLFWASKDAKLNNTQPHYRGEEDSRMHLSVYLGPGIPRKEHWVPTPSLRSTL